jgi:hypothetical protein
VGFVSRCHVGAYPGCFVGDWAWVRPCQMCDVVISSCFKIRVPLLRKLGTSIICTVDQPATTHLTCALLGRVTTAVSQCYFDLDDEQYRFVLSIVQYPHSKATMVRLLSPPWRVHGANDMFAVRRRGMVAPIAEP